VMGLGGVCSGAIWLRRVGLLAACGIVMTTAVATAQTIEELRERFIAECRPQFIHLKKQKGQDIRPLVQKCVREKFETMFARIRSQELRLAEFDFWLLQKKKKGPSEAKGVIYYIRGYSPAPKPLKDMNFGPFFLSTLSERGWDVIAAQLPLDVSHALPSAVYLPAAVRFARQRIKELKARGYKRIVLAGHSWGAWIVMEAATAGPLEADLLLVNAPATYGKRTLPNGEVIDDTLKNESEYARMVEIIEKPIVLMHFAGDDLETGDRGAIATAALAKRAIPALIIDKPRAFTGHYVSNFPIFDYAFGGCIEEFLDSPATRPCTPKPLSPSDFRSVVRIDQIANYETKLATSADALVGRKFVLFRFGGPEEARHAEYVSRQKRKSMQREAESLVDFHFRDGIHCAGTACGRLVKWSDDRLLEFDPESGKIKGWWIER
jgi:pimeloyl-ACP methyl ester carboxylesterase